MRRDAASSSSRLPTRRSVMTRMAAPNNLSLLLANIIRMARRSVLEAGLPDYLSEADLRLLICLSSMEGCCQTALAEELDVTIATVGRQLGALKARELVICRSHPTDRRTTSLHLGPRAREQIERSQSALDGVASAAMKRLTRAEQTELLRLLHVVHTTLYAGGNAQKARNPLTAASLR